MLNEEFFCCLLFFFVYFIAFRRAIHLVVAIIRSVNVDCTTQRKRKVRRLNAEYNERKKNEERDDKRELEFLNKKYNRNERRMAVVDKKRINSLEWAENSN